MEELTVSTGDAEVIVDVSSGDVEILEDTTGNVLQQEDYVGTAESGTLVDVSEVVAAVQSLERSVEQLAISICVVLGIIAGAVVMKGFWIARDC